MTSAEASAAATKYQQHLVDLEITNAANNGALNAVFDAAKIICVPLAPYTTNGYHVSKIGQQITISWGPK